MTHLLISPLQWSRLPDLRDVAPLQPGDHACMREVQEVLRRHGRLERFALQLVHRHFDMSAHEILLETSDAEARELHVRVATRASAAARHAIPTAWTLANAEAVAACVCAIDGGLGHAGRHESKGPRGRAR